MESTTLIISEKPTSAKRIAEALADKNIEKKKNKKIQYYKITHNGEKIIVGCAVGHLFTLAEKKKAEWHYPVFDIEWKPSYQQSDASKFTKDYFDTLTKLAKNADTFINACDLDREGEVIFKNILRFICKKEDAKRMRFSTLTKSDLIDAYKNISPHIDFGLADAGETRHYIDYYWGISLSRALTLALKSTGGYRTLSTGRVQGPALNIIEDREKKIRAFRSTPFWNLELEGSIDKKNIIAMHISGNFLKKSEAETILQKCKGNDGKIFSFESKQRKESPPEPFDLTTLQRESYRYFGYSPKQTLDNAQTLYEHALISYPRTSSQKLPAKIGYKNIIQNLMKQQPYTDNCKKLLIKTLKPNEGKKSDPAHPSIFPTGHMPKGLNQYQKKVYDLIVRRFLATFAETAIRETSTVVIDVNNEKFSTTGVRTIKPGWLNFYKPYGRFKEQILPEIKKGEKVNVERIDLLEKETQPPKRYSQASIIKKLEDLGLGTKATRALILQTLYDRSYIKNRSIEMTPLGEAVIESLEKHCDEIISVDLTTQMENDMEKIEEGKLKKEDIIEKSKNDLKKILEKFRQKENEIGKELLVGVKKIMIDETHIGKCKCGGDLVIKYTPSRSRLIGCSNYPRCKQTYSLPQKGSLNILDERCECGLKIIQVKAFRKRPWKLCVKCGFKK